MSWSSAVQKAVWRTLGTDDWEVAFESPTRLCLELANERRLRGPVGVEAPERDVAQQAISCDVAVLNLGPIQRLRSQGASPATPGQDRACSAAQAGTGR